MSDMTLTFKTSPATVLFEKVLETSKPYVVSPELAEPGDFIGVRINIRASLGRHAIYTGFPIDEFIVMQEDGSFGFVDYGDLPENRRIDAALLAMDLNRARLHHDGDVQETLEEIDNSDGDLYAYLIVLPTLAILYAEMYEDIMEILEDDPEYSQEELDQHFHILRRTAISHHEALGRHEAEQRDLAILNSLVPLKEDYSMEETITVTLPDPLAED